VTEELAKAEAELVSALTDTFAAFLRFQRLRMAHRAVEEILGETKPEATGGQDEGKQD